MCAGADPEVDSEERCTGKTGEDLRDDVDILRRIRGASGSSRRGGAGKAGVIQTSSELCPLVFSVDACDEALNLTDFSA